jgi:hypothetical protein
MNQVIILFSLFVSGALSATEANYAWWVTYKYEPVSVQLQNIKASEINPDFEAISILSCEPPITFKPHECREIEENNLALKVIGDFNSDGIKEIWHAGVARTINGKYHKFLLAISESGKQLHFLSEEFDKPGFSALMVRDHSLSWVMCMECGHLADVVWSNKSFQLVWLGDY